MPTYKPRPGLVIPDPDRNFRPMPADGLRLEEPLPTYWNDRLANGEIELVPDPTEA